MIEFIVLVDPAGAIGDGFKQAAKKLGFEVIAVFSQPLPIYQAIFHASAESMLQNCQEVIVAQPKEEVLKRLKKYPIKAALAATESGVELADEIAHDLGLWGNAIEYSLARRDKGEMRKLVKNARLSCPDFMECDTDQKVIQFMKKHSFPLVIKTPKGAGTKQVFVCEDETSLLRFFHEICNEKDLYGITPDHALIEEFIGGKEYVVDTFSDGEKVHVTDIWVYDKIDTANFKNIYYNVYTLPLDEPSMAPLIAYAKQIAKLFGMKRGISHIELKDDPTRGPTLIEMGARIIGSNLSRLITKYTNFDPYRCSIEVFVHGKIKIPEPIIYHKYFAVAFCPIFSEGRVGAILGIEEIEKLASYDFHSLRVKIGERAVPTTDVTTTPFLVYLSHSDREQIQKDLITVHEYFQLELHA